MILQNLHTYQYRNIEDISIECDESINCIIGKNGVGKTNLLDSIYFLAACKSNIITNDSLNVNNSKTAFLIQGNFIDNKKEYKIACSYDSIEKEKRIICNDKKYARFSDHIGLIPIIFICPADISLINGGGSERRKFIDTYISQYDTEYLQNLVAYHKILNQRNTILKQDKKIDYTYLEIIDSQLCEYAELIYAQRKAAISELEKITVSYYQAISNTDECAFQYDSQRNQQPFEQLLQKNFEKDSILGYTTAGVHRDDITFLFNSGFLKHGGSQGQKKSFLLAIKFAQYQSLQEKKKQSPIILLDDLFDKLDSERTKKVLDIVDGQEFGQIFITDTDKALLETFFFQTKNAGTFWKFEQGSIKKSR